jgi:hypothetical protein
VEAVKTEWRAQAASCRCCTFVVLHVLDGFDPAVHCSSRLPAVDGADNSAKMPHWAAKSSRGKPEADASHGTMASAVLAVFAVPPGPITDPTAFRLGPITDPTAFRPGIGLDNQLCFDQPLAH